MEIFTTSLSYVLYGLTMFVGVMLFCSRKAWKEWFIFKVAIFWIIYIAFMVSLAVISVLTDAPQWLEYINYSLSGYSIVIFMLFMFRENKAKLFYNVFAGMLVRYAASKIIGAVFHFYPLEVNILQTVISSLVIFATYIPVYFVFARYIAQDEEFNPSVREVAFIGVLSFLVLPSAFLEPLMEVSNLAYVYLIFIEVAICYGFLGFQFIMYNNSKRIAHVMVDAELAKRRVEQYENFKGVIEIMNHKVHDLKHQIRHLAKEHEVSDEVLHGLEGAVTDYEAFVRTGNETLDTLLTEKKFACISRKINVKCMVDGSAFDFLSVEDINALFGNLIDNAIEHLVTVEDEALRFLEIASARSDFFIKLSVENYCSEGAVRFDKKGFPVTGKADKSMHGFGTKSIARIAEKYGGNAAFRVEDGNFKAQVIFPVKE